MISGSFISGPARFAELAPSVKRETKGTCLVGAGDIMTAPSLLCYLFVLQNTFIANKESNLAKLYYFDHFSSPS